MFDSQTAGIALYALCGIALFVLLPSAVIEGHTGRRMPGCLPAAGWRSSPGALLLEIPLILFLVGGTQFVMAVLVLSPNSGLVTRLIAATELGLFVAWNVYLIRSLRDGSRG